MTKNRNTTQKDFLKEELGRINYFFSAEEFYEIISKKRPTIGIATIYRFLKQMKKENQLYSYTCDRKQVYSKNEKSHCHFICENTGKVMHFEIDSLDFLKNKIPGSISSFQIEVKGICKDGLCKKKE